MNMMEEKLVMAIGGSLYKARFYTSDGFQNRSLKPLE